MCLASVIFLFLPMTEFSLSIVTREHHFTFFSSVAGIGDVMATVAGVSSVLSCALECSKTGGCNAANYHHGNSTCDLLAVNDVLSDFEDGNEVTYMCTGCNEPPTGDVGYWPLMDGAHNQRHPGAEVVTVGVSYVPAAPGSATNVLSLPGSSDAYVLLENSGGELAVQSFTWAVNIYPESADNAPLFVWALDNPDCYYAGHRIWQFTQKLYFRTCATINPAPNLMSDVTLGVGTWQTVAVSYDAVTGVSQLYVNGMVKSGASGVIAPGSTLGPVLMGSWYNYSNPDAPDTRAFQGRMACMRLWSEAFDLNTLWLDSPRCRI